MAAPDTGSRIVLMLVEVVAGAGDEERICSVTGVESRATLPEIVNRLRMHATIATGVAISPETVKNPKRRESSVVITAAKLVMWHATVTTAMSRSATPAVASDTSRNYVTRSSVTGVARSVTWLCSAARRLRSTATTAARPVTWPENAPLKRLRNFFPLSPLLS